MLLGFLSTIGLGVRRLDDQDSSCSFTNNSGWFERSKLKLKLILVTVFF